MKGELEGIIRRRKTDNRYEGRKGRKGMKGENEGRKKKE